MKKIFTLSLIIILAVAAILARLLPHPANFTPVAAVALFAGYYLPKKWAIILPLIIMLASDLFIGFYDWKLMLVVYSCLIINGLLGLIIRNHRQPLAVLTATLTGSLLFFLLTNLAVWLFSTWYAHNLPDLLLCYTLAIPFFKNTLLGDLFFTGVFFTSYELLKFAWHARQLMIKQKSTITS